MIPRTSGKLHPVYSNTGYSVASAPSGEEAVEYLKTNRLDLLVLDMIMDPGMMVMNLQKDC